MRKFVTVVSIVFVLVMLPAVPSSAQANPAGCSTAAHDPHESHHKPGTINAEVRQTCPLKVNLNSAEAKLWEKRWWGFNTLDTSFSNKRRRKNTSVFVNAGCRDNEMRVTGYGHYEWAGQHVRSAEVFNTKHVDC